MKNAKLIGIWKELYDHRFKSQTRFPTPSCLSAPNPFRRNTLNKVLNQTSSWSSLKFWSRDVPSEKGIWIQHLQPECSSRNLHPSSEHRRLCLQLKEGSAAPSSPEVGMPLQEHQAAPSFPFLNKHCMASHVKNQYFNRTANIFHKQSQNSPTYFLFK